MSENVPIQNAETPAVANAETVAWGSDPAGPVRERSPRNWQAPAVIGLLLLAVLASAVTGITLGARESDELIAERGGAPANGVCRTYDSVAALAVSNDSPTVPCTGPHSAQTFAVGDALPEPREDYTWNESAMQTAADEICGDDETAGEALGLSTEEYGITRFAVAFFTPTAAEAKGGARWVRCDLLLTDRGRTATVSGSFEELAEIDGAFARCSGLSIGATNNAPTRCTDSADLSAVIGTATFVTLTDPDAAGEVRERCRELAVEKSGLETPSWSATLPQNTGGSGGYGLCWLRADQWKVDRAAWPEEQVVGAPGDSVSV